MHVVYLCVGTKLALLTLAGLGDYLALGVTSTQNLSQKNHKTHVIGLSCIKRLGKWRTPLDFLLATLAKNSFVCLH